MTINETKNDRIFIISQVFYGNRTGTEVSRDEVDYFLRGETDRKYFCPEDIRDVERRFVRIPGPGNIVIVYDRTQEDSYVNVEFPEAYARDGRHYKEVWGEELKMHVTCEIPEIGFTLHTRCFACRMDENGVLQSLERDDYKRFIHYFPVR